MAGDPTMYDAFRGWGNDGDWRAVALNLESIVRNLDKRVTELERRLEEAGDG